jgi:hypothetical protein
VKALRESVRVELQFGGSVIDVTDERDELTPLVSRSETGIQLYHRNFSPREPRDGVAVGGFRTECTDNLRIPRHCSSPNHQASDRRPDTCLRGVIVVGQLALTTNHTPKIYMTKHIKGFYGSQDSKQSRRHPSWIRKVGRIQSAGMDVWVEVGSNNRGKTARTRR